MKNASLIGVTVVSVATANLYAADWSGSYSADGQCYCVGEIDKGVRNKIVPSPVGGQSVQQVCSRIGAGPELIHKNGKFNFAVFKDQQCGNGPFSASADPVTENCAGSFEPDAGDCQAIGPKWDLKTAYSRPAPQPQKPASVQQLAESRPIVKNGPRYIKAPTVRIEEKVEAVVKAPDVKKERVAIKPPAEKKETLEEIRARQERLLAEARARAKRRAFAEKDKAAEQQKKLAAQTAQQKAAEERKVARRLAAEHRAREQLRADKRAAAENQKLAEQELRRQERAEQEAARARQVEQEQRLAAQEAERQRELKAQIEAEKQEQLAAEQEREKQRALAAKKQKAVDETAKTVADGSGETSSTGIVSALRLPKSTRASSREFGYVDAMPVNYAFGGAGVQLEASASGLGNTQYMVRMGVASEYKEMAFGISYLVTPPKADRMTLVMTAGVEFGSFSLEEGNIKEEFSSSGLFLGLSSRLVANNRFELQAGVGYSSFYGGDPSVFGTGFYHVNRKLDVLSRFELGDNDSLGLGIRFYY